jgi:hypothetical protein
MSYGEARRENPESPAVEARALTATFLRYAQAYFKHAAKDT